MTKTAKAGKARKIVLDPTIDRSNWPWSDGYVRVSNDDSGRGRSPEEQEEAIRREAERIKVRIRHIYRDNDIGASRYTPKKVRPDWLKAKAAIASGEISMLITWSSSRAQRDLAVYMELRQLCEDNRVLWHYNGRTLDMSDAKDRHDSAQDAIDDEYAADKISIDVCRAVKTNAEEGRPHGQVPFGYTRTYDAKTGESLGQVADPVEGEVVKEVTRRLIAGESLTTVAASLTARGVMTSRGNYWSNRTLRRMAMNPAYCGQRVYRGKVLDDVVTEWPALISQLDHARLVKILTDESRLSHHQTKRCHLLSGVAKCDVCKSPLVIHKVMERKRYLCSSPQRCVTIPEEELDRFVVGTLLKRFASGDGLAEFYKEATPDVVTKQAEIARLTASLKDDIRAKIAGTISAAMLGELETQTNAAIAEIKRTMKPSGIPSSVEALATATDPYAYWASKDLTLEMRVAIIRAVMSIRLDRAKVRGSTKVDLGRVDITWKF